MDYIISLLTAKLSLFQLFLFFHRSSEPREHSKTQRKKNLGRELEKWEMNTRASKNPDLDFCNPKEKGPQGPSPFGSGPQEPHAPGRPNQCGAPNPTSFY